MCTPCQQLFPFPAVAAMIQQSFSFSAFKQAEVALCTMGRRMTRKSAQQIFSTVRLLGGANQPPYLRQTPLSALSDLLAKEQSLIACMCVPYYRWERSSISPTTHSFMIILAKSFAGFAWALCCIMASAPPLPWGNIIHNNSVLHFWKSHHHSVWVHRR